ncbi:hypothetical protein CVS40_9375 [Lucilia cuprina]|nr:hypothetical protein CVS40_9375 [Lucilia cuprina]
MTMAKIIHIQKRLLLLFLKRFYRNGRNGNNGHQQKTQYKTHLQHFKIIYKNLICCNRTEMFN